VIGALNVVTGFCFPRLLFPPLSSTSVCIYEIASMTLCPQVMTVHAVMAMRAAQVQLCVVDANAAFTSL
jgi:hypothetical protein